MGYTFAWKFVTNDTRSPFKIFTVGCALWKALYISLLLAQGQYGIFFTEGSEWVEQRNFATKCLKSLGFGSGQLMEPLILQDVQELCDWVKKTKCQDKFTNTIKLNEILFQATINALWTMTTCERIKLGDSEVARLFTKSEETLQYTMRTGLGFFPWLKYLAPELSGYLRLDRIQKELHNFLRNKFEEHEQTYKEGSRRDFIDNYLEHVINAKKLEENGELLMAGGSTSSSNIHWALVYLAHNQQVQKKMQAEIDEIIGRDRDPSVADKERMPYTEAVILETLRIASVVPFRIIHELLEDLTFDQFTFPKGMLLVPNIYHVHHDPNIWGDPDVFRPERFLVEVEGHNLRESLVPFQRGKRQCLGEPLAKNLLFLFLTKLMQQFNVSPDPFIPKEEYFKPDVGLLLLPKSLGLVMEPK